MAAILLIIGTAAALSLPRECVAGWVTLWETS